MLEAAVWLCLSVMNVGNTPTFRRPSCKRMHILDITWASEFIVQDLVNWKGTDDYTDSSLQFYTYRLLKGWPKILICWYVHSNGIQLSWGDLCGRQTEEQQFRKGEGLPRRQVHSASHHPAAASQWLIKETYVVTVNLSTNSPTNCSPLKGVFGVEWRAARAKWRNLGDAGSQEYKRAKKNF